MTTDLELRLIDAPTPDGEIAAKDLAALATALQELVTRVGREVLDTPGPGRTKQFMEEAAQLRLSGIDSGSTVLLFRQGPVDKLDVDLPEQTVAEERFWQIIEAIGEDRRPPWASDLIAASAAKLVNALQDAAPRSRISTASGARVDIEAARIHSQTWATTRAHRSEQMEAKGRLEKVDLRSHEFRVRDDVGHAVDLKHVVDDAEVAQYVGQWVAATGTGIVASGRLVALDDARVLVLEDPAREFAGDTVPSLEELLASAPGPDPDGGIVMSDEEFAAFLEAARA
jgi:hypothetical protein